MDDELGDPAMDDELPKDDLQEDAGDPTTTTEKSSPRPDTEEKISTAAPSGQKSPTAEGDLHVSHFNKKKAAEKEAAAKKNAEALKMKLKAAAMKTADGGNVSWSKMFQKYDTDGSGEIGFDEFRMAIRKEAKVSTEMLGEDQLRTLFKSMDVDGDGSIDFDKEFVPWMEKKHATGKEKLRGGTDEQRRAAIACRDNLKRTIKRDKEVAEVKAQVAAARRGICAASYGGAGGAPKWMSIFQKYDTDCSGDVGFEAFVKALRKDARVSMGALSEKGMKALFDFLDMDNDGTVNYTDEFVPFLECTDIEELFERRGLTKGGAYRPGRKPRGNRTPESTSPTVRSPSAQLSSQDLDLSTQIAELSSMVRKQAKVMERMQSNHAEELHKITNEQNAMCSLLHSSGTVQEHSFQRALSWTQSDADLGSEATSPASPTLADSPNSSRSAPSRASRRSQSLPNSPSAGSAPSSPFTCHNPEAQDLFELCLPLLHKSTAKRMYDKAFKNVQAALSRGVKPDMWRGPGTPLLGAVEAGCLELVSLLIQAKASVNVRNEQGVSPLHIASFHGAVDTCIMLLDHNADPNMPDRHDQTPLFFPPTRQICELLFQRVADISALNSIGQSAFHLAGKAGYGDVLLWFMHHLPRAIVDLKDADGCTALKYAEGTKVPLAILKKMHNWEPVLLDKEFKKAKLQDKSDEISAEMQDQIRLKLKAAAYWRGGVSWADIFTQYDSAGHGELNYAEFHDAMREGANVAPSMLSDQGLSGLFKKMDTDGGGTLNYEEEFLPWLEQTIEPDQSEQEPEPVRSEPLLNVGMMTDIKRRLKACAYTNGVLSWKSLFRYYDRDNSGEINFKEFASGIRKSAKIPASVIPNEALLELFNYLDKDGGGVIEYESEFLHWLEPGGVADGPEQGFNKSETLKEYEELKRKDHKLHLDNQVVHIKRQLMIASMVNGEVNMKRLFKGFDKADDGELEFPEFLALIRKQAKVTPKMLKDSHLKALFKAIDTNRNDVLEYETEFLPWLGIALGEDEPKEVYTYEAAQKQRAKAVARTVVKHMAEVKEKITRAAYHNGGLDWDRLFKECETVGKPLEKRGCMDLTEFTTLIRKKAKLQPPIFTEEVIRALFDDVDVDDSGEVDLEGDFLPWLENADAGERILGKTFSSAATSSLPLGAFGKQRSMGKKTSMGKQMSMGKKMSKQPTGGAFGKQMSTKPVSPKTEIAAIPE